MVKGAADFLSRQALLWILAALALGFLPHMVRFPLWLSAAALLALLWRFMMHLGRWPAPPVWLKALLVVGSMGGIYLTYGKSFAIENMVALLAAGALLKPLEAYRQRDIHVLLCVCCFLLGSHFLFAQSPLSAVYVLLGFWVIMCAWLALYQVEGGAVGTGRLALRLLAQSWPLALVLFVVVPRVGPLWSINLRSDSALVGLSESMSPGQFSHLSQSDELAFRVAFNGPVPDNSLLYWRALVLDAFDGQTWSAAVVHPEVNWYSPSQALPPGSLEYQVMLEPHQQNWLFALDKAIATEPQTGTTADFRLVSQRPVINQKIYQAASDLQARLGAEPLSEEERSQNLSLPRSENMQSQQLAASIANRSRDPHAILQAVQDFYLQGNFAYTLQPPLSGAHNTVDGFLFTSRQGYCAHFAGSFVYLMRAAGVPARVVVGYQGGEFNQKGNYLAVYQYSAHAWAEVWFADGGWQRVDPTAWVAPARISLGLEESLKDEFMQNQFFSAHRYKHNAVINQLRQRLEAMNYYWNNVILSYSAKDQQALFASFAGQDDYWQLVLIIMVTVALIFIGLALYVLRPVATGRREPLPRLFDQLCAELRNKGVVLPVPSSVTAVFATLQQYAPEHTVALGVLCKQYEYWLYQSPQPANKTTMQQLRRQQQDLLKKI